MKGVNVYFRKENLNSINPENDLLLTVLFASAERENQMRSERFKGLDFEHLVYERAILDRKKDNLYIMDKELKEEFKRRITNGSNV